MRFIGFNPRFNFHFIFQMLHYCNGHEFLNGITRLHKTTRMLIHSFKFPVINHKGDHEIWR